MIPPPAPEALLADTKWLRALTRRLVGADHADDLHQDVAVAALTRPQAAASGRSWLAAVAHNLAVSLQRRRAVAQRQLRSMPRSEPAPSPQELVAHAELQQRAVAAVLALPEPYRETVLLRFLQGLTLQATAQAMDVPVETVRTRQQRALAMLRTQLVPDQERSGLALLLPSLVAASITVKVKHAIVVSAAILLTLLVTVPLLQQSNQPSEVAGAAGQAAAAQAESAERSASMASVDPALPLPRTPVPAARPPVEVASAAVTVEVHWQDGTPAKGIAVHCHAAGSVGTFAATDPNGTVHFADLLPDRYTITTPQYDSRFVTLVAGERATLALELQPGFAVRGRVLDANGGPVAGAELLLTHAAVAPNWPFPIGRTDGLGSFEVRGCRGGMLLGASAIEGLSDFALLTEAQHGGATPSEVVLHLRRASGSVRGQVRDRNGRPVVGAWVQLGDQAQCQLDPDAEGVLWSPPGAALTTTGAEGRFALPRVRVGEQQLWIVRAGFAPYHKTVSIDAHARHEWNVELQPGAELAGQVHDDEGQPVAGAVVSWDGWYPAAAQCETAADGTYRLGDLPDGRLEVAVTARGLDAQQVSFVFRVGEPRHWDFVLSRGLRIRGQLVGADGQPLAGWMVARHGADRRTKTDDDGRFTVPECDAAGNTLTVQDGWGFVPEILRWHQVLPGEQERVFVVPADRLASARVRGQFVDPDGLPLAEVAIHCLQDGREVLLHNRVIRVGIEGTIDVGPFPPGSYQLTPRHQRFVFAPIELELQPNEIRDLGVLLPISSTRR